MCCRRNKLASQQQFSNQCGAKCCGYRKSQCTAGPCRRPVKPIKPAPIKPAPIELEQPVQLAPIKPIKPVMPTLPIEPVEPAPIPPIQPTEPAPILPVLPACKANCICIDLYAPVCCGGRTHSNR